jgi:hypothetical protein
MMEPLRLVDVISPNEHLKAQLTGVSTVPLIPFYHIYDVIVTESGERLVVIGPQDRFRNFDDPQHPKPEEIELLTLTQFQKRFGSVHLDAWISFFKKYETKQYNHKHKKPKTMTGGVKLAGEVLFHFKTVSKVGDEIVYLVLDGMPYDNHESLAAAVSKGNKGKQIHRGTTNLVRNKADIERDGGVAYQIQKINLYQLDDDLREKISRQSSMDIHMLNAIPPEHISHPFTVSDTELFALMTIGHGDSSHKSFGLYLKGLKTAMQSLPQRLFNQTVRPRDQYLYSPAVWWKFIFVGLLGAFWASQNPLVSSKAAVMGVSAFAGGEAVLNMMFTTSSRSFFSKPNTVFHTYMATFMRSVLYGITIKSIQYMDLMGTFENSELLWHILSHSMITTAAKFYFTRLNKEMQEVTLLGNKYEVNRINNDVIRRVNGWVYRFMPERLHGLAIPDDAIQRATRRQITYEVFYDVMKQADLLFGDNSQVLKPLIRFAFMATGLFWAYSYYALELLTKKGEGGLARQLNSSSRWYDPTWLSLRNFHRVAGHFIQDAIYHDLIMKSGRSAVQKFFPSFSGIRCNRRPKMAK